MHDDQIMNIDEIDDSVLSMFVDGELDEEIREVVLTAMETNPEICNRIYELRRVKDLMKLGYGTAKPPSRVQASTPASVSNAPVSKQSGRICIPGPYGLAASLFLIGFSFIMGFFGHTGSALIGDNPSSVVAIAAPIAQDRVLLHVSEANPEKFREVLSYAKDFLEKHKKNNGQVAVLVNASGLDMMRKGVSPFEQEIMAMMREYKNVHFIACINSIRALRSKGINPVIMHNVDTSKPLMEQIVAHVQDGWSYIRVKTVPGEAII